MCKCHLKKRKYEKERGCFFYHIVMGWWRGGKKIHQGNWFLEVGLCKWGAARWSIERRSQSVCSSRVLFLIFSTSSDVLAKVNLLIKEVVCLLSSIFGSWFPFADWYWAWIACWSWVWLSKNTQSAEYETNIAKS